MRANGMNFTYHDIAKMIDHSLLPPALTERELEAGCALALEYDGGECVHSAVLPAAVRRVAHGQHNRGEHHDWFPAWWSHHRDQAG